MFNKFLSIFSLITLVGTTAFAHDHDNNAPSKSNSVKFIENKGQWNTEAKYKLDIDNGSVFLTNKGFVYTFVSSEDLKKVDEAYHSEQTGVDVNNMILRNHAYKVNFVGVNTNISYTPSEKTITKYSYFIGNDPNKWVSGASAYGAVTQENIYDGVDLKMYSTNNGLKYDIIVAPNANADVIKFQFDGVSPNVTENGDLQIQTTVNEVIEKAPYTYQLINGEQVEVKSHYKLDGNILSFEFPNGYDESLPLIIDPNLIFLNFSGATTGTYYAHSTGYDNDGNTITVALAYSNAWPTTVGAFNTTYGGSNTAAMHKYNEDGSALIFGSYVGGSTGTGNMVPNTVRADEQGNIYFAGSALNASLPVVAGGYQAALGGASDIYIGCLSPDGTTLIASTYLGGSGPEGSLMNSTATYTGNSSQNNPITPTDIVFDGNGNLWIVSNTGSSNFPVTANAYQAALSGSHDAFLAQLNPDLTTLMYSTFYGGTAWDGGTSIEYDASRNYVGFTGFTNSSNLATTSGAYNGAAPGGTSDGFVTLFDVANTNLVASSYIGTNNTDVAIRIAFDCVSNVYVAGRTQGNYPITATGTFVVPNGYIFIDKLNPTLTASIASTRTGAANTSIVPSAMMVDVCGNILVATTVNNTSQPNMPLTQDAFETNPRAFYFAAFAPNFGDLVFGSYFGSTASIDHFHPGICRIDPAGIIYHAVCSPTAGTNWSMYETPHAIHPQKLNGGTNDNATFKFDFEAFSVKVTGETPEGGNVPQNHAIRGCKSAFLYYERATPDTFDLVLKLEILGDAINGVDYQFIADSLVIPANDSVASLEIKALLANPATGPRRVIINTMAPCACDGNENNVMSSDTVLILDSVYVEMITPLDTTCPNDTISITADIDPTLDFFWSPANLIPDATGLTINPAPAVTTIYTIEVSQPGAPATCPSRKASYVAYVEPYPVISVPNDYLTVCYQDSIGLTMQVTPELSGYIYNWTPDTYLGSQIGPSIKFFAPVGLYKIYMNVVTPGAGCSASDSMMINVVPPLTLQGVTPKDTLINYGDEIKLHVIGPDAVMWSWRPLHNVYDPMLQTIDVSPTEDKIYTVRAWDQFGCYAEDSAIVRVYHRPRFFIPNAFSPNGDGLNDEFKIENLTYEKLISFKVFNRWGELMFETIDPNKGWDGTNKAGKAVPQDVYFYQIIISGPTEDTEMMTYKGDVTLIN